MHILAEKSIFNVEDTYEKAIKKAKKKSLKRTIKASIVVSLLVVVAIVAILFVAHLYMQKTMIDYSNMKHSESIVRGANISFDRSTASYGVESAIEQDQYRKNIDGIPYTWYNEQTFYKIYDKPTTIFDTTITSFDGEQYYRNGQQVMNFLYPGMNSTNDDIDLIATLDGNDKIEVALSFKEELPVGLLLDKFPSAQWAWVIDPMNRQSFENSLQDIGKDYVSYLISEYAYGFSVQSEITIEQNVKEFKGALRELADKKSNARDLLEAVQDSLDVGGIVVTGTVEEIRPMIESENINHVSVGVIMKR